MTYGATSSGSSIKQSASAQRRTSNEQASAALSIGLSQAQSSTPSIQWTVYFLAGCAALNSCSLGFDLGINTYAGPLLMEDLKLTTKQFEFFMGSLSLSAIAGCGAASFLSDLFGRRASFVVSNVAILSGLTIVCTGRIYEVLLLGRAFVGLGVGIGLCVGPLYLAEISPPMYRGWFVSWSEVSINIGTVLAFWVGWLGSSMAPHRAWQCMFALGGVLPLFVLIMALTFMLESPRWLLQKDRNEEAKMVVTRLFGAQTDVAAIIQEVSASLAEEAKAYDTHGWSNILCPTGGLKWMLFVGVLSGISQQVIAIEPMVFYMEFIINGTTPVVGQPMLHLSWYPVLIISVKLSAVIMAGFLMDVQGRRPLMILSFLGMGVACSALSIMFFMENTSRLMVVRGLMAYFAFFSVGAGPGAWLLSSELFSNSVRAKGMSVAALLNRLVGAIEVTTFLSLAEAIGMAKVFAGLAALSFVYALFFWSFLPETKSRTLEEISDHFCAMAGPAADLETKGE
jgi:sugar porter (SP) family MFS transporter